MSVFAQAHCRYFVVREFAEVVDQQSTSRAVQQVLLLLFRVYLAHTVSRTEADFIMVSESRAAGKGGSRVI